MRTQKGFAFIIVFFLCFALHAQKWTLKLHSTVELRTWKLSNKVDKTERPLSGATVSLLNGSTVIKQVNTDGGGDFTMEVPPGGEYIIEISYPECNAKRLAVSTINVPDEVAKDNFKPGFNIIGGFVMAKAFPGIDYSALQQPLTKVLFYQSGKKFDNDKGATDQMLGVLGSIAGAESDLAEKFAAANKAGDVALAKGNCPLAKTNYEKALGLIPNEAYPTGQLALVDKCLKEKGDADKAAAEKAEAEKIAKEKADAEKAAADKAAAEKALADKAAAEKAAAEKAEAEKLAKEKAAADKAAADKAAAEKALADKAALEKAAAEKAEAEKLAKEKAAADKAAADKAVAEKALADKAASEKAAAEKAEAEKLAKEKAAADKAAADKAAAEKALADKTASEKAAAEKAEAEKLAKEKAAADKAAADKAAAEKALADKAASEKAAAEKAEAEKLAKEKAAADKAAADKAAAEKALAEKAAKEKAAAEKVLAEKLAKEKAAAEKMAAQKALAEKAVADKQAKEKEAAEKAAADKLAKEKAAAERAEAERIAKEKAANEKTGVIVAKDNAPVVNEPSDPDVDAKHRIPSALGADKYKVALKKAEDYFKMKRYAEAKTAYEDVLKIRPDDAYSKNKLSEIEKLLNGK